MSRMTRRIAGATCRILVATLLAPLAGLAASPPNFVLIVADDLGWGDLGCYGSDVHATPAIDALAAKGLRFTDFHSAGAMCSPTRASILTGQYPQRFGPLFDGALSGTKQRHLGLPLEAVTLAEVLREAGYATGCFGKYGDFHTRVDRSGHRDWWDGEKPVIEEGYTTSLLTDHAVTFIETHRERPFFLYLPHLAIHFPWQGPDDPAQRTPGKSWHDDKWGIIPDPGNVSPHVKAMVESLDESVGRIVSILRELGLEENTLVIFTSDNGGYLTYGKNFRNISHNGPWRGQKTEVYEGGHRVPLVVSWPGRIAPGRSDTLVHSNDIFPTLASLAGASWEADAVDGIDLGPHLFHRHPVEERALSWRTRSHYAFRSGPWKLIVPRSGGGTQLYHLGNDPGEQVNLAGNREPVVRELLEQWQTAAPAPPPRTP